MSKLTPQILAMYLGQQVFVPEENKTGILSSTSWHHGEIVILDVQYSEKDDYTVLNENNDITRVKPILRKLQDMTEEEHLEIERLPDAYWGQLNADQFAYLLSKSFDLFGLIESGDAI